MSESSAQTNKAQANSAQTNKAPGYGREALICAAAAFVYTVPFLARIDWWGVHDWELFTAMAEIPRLLIFEFAQFPFWNPYLGGGNILFHHPEVAVLTPVYLLSLVFGAVVGLKLQVALCYFLGFWGSVRLARVLGVSELGSYLLAAIYFGGSYFALHFAEGHIPFTHFCFLPWALYFWVRSLRESRYILGAGLALGLMILGNGAAVPFLYTSTFWGLTAALFALQRKSATPLLRFVQGWSLGVALAAVKLLPMLAYLSDHPWAGDPLDTVPLAALVSAFFSFDQGLFSHLDLGLNGGWHEYGAYLSPLALGLAIWRLKKNLSASWVWLTLGVFFLLLGLGGFADWSPWKLFSHLPGFASSRAPGRAFQFVLLPVGILAALGFDRIYSDLKRHLGASPLVMIFAVGAFVVVAGGNLLIARQSLSQTFVRHPQATVWSEEFRQSVGDANAVYQAVRENRGTILSPWLSGYPEGRGLITETGEVLPEYVIYGAAETISRSYRGNKIEYRFRNDYPAVVTLGMGYDPGWRVVSPALCEIREEQGLIAVTADPGEELIQLAYRPPFFWLGAAISTLTLLAFLVVLLGPARLLGYIRRTN